MSKKNDSQQKKMRQFEREAGKVVTRGEATAIAQEVSNVQTNNLMVTLRPVIENSLLTSYAIVDLLIEKGIFTKDELNDKLAQTAERLKEDPSTKDGKGVDDGTNDKEEEFKS